MIIKRPKVQLPGHVQPISVPTQKPHEDEDEGPSHDPTASSSNDNTVPLPTTTPTSFTPGDFAQPAQQQSSQRTPELVSSQNDDDETEPYETDDTPVLTEEDISQLQEEDVDTEPYTSDHSHFVNIDGAVFVPLLLLILVHTMLLGSNSLNSILPRMERSSQRQNQLSLKKS